MKRRTRGIAVAAAVALFASFAGLAGATETEHIGMQILPAPGTVRWTAGSRTGT